MPNTLVDPLISCRLPQPIMHWGLALRFFLRIDGGQRVRDE